MDGQLNDIRSKLAQYHDAERATHSLCFFKTGPGEYGEGDQFLGITVPQIRKIVAIYPDLPLPTIEKLLYSKWHEERLLALLILVKQFSKAKEEKQQTAIFNFYLEHIDQVNNWDLVDSSAHKIVGAYLYPRSTALLDELVSSSTMWHRRIAVVASFYFIRQGKLDLTLQLAEELLEDPADLMHKAVGWMLREVGKKNLKVLLCFLDSHSAFMPCTMLSYAIERLTPTQKKWYRAQKRKK